MRINLHVIGLEPLQVSERRLLRGAGLESA